MFLLQCVLFLFFFWCLWTTLLLEILLKYSSNIGLRFSRIRFVYCDFKLSDFVIYFHQRTFFLFFMEIEVDSRNRLTMTFTGLVKISRNNRNEQNTIYNFYHFFRCSYAHWILSQRFQLGKKTKIIILKHTTECHAKVVLVTRAVFKKCDNLTSPNW